MKISIIIPAYNEENTIARCLKRLLEGPCRDDLEIIVVCNGCSDNTADRARSINSSVIVVELDQGSKTLALNKGDALASHFPRFYIDADITLDQKDLLRVASVLYEGEALAAAPKMEIDMSRASRSVKSYYRVWTNTPYTYSGMLGSGIYGVSEEGRKRFGDFPDIIADDGYIRLLFHPSERKTVNDASFTITSPETMKWLLAINTRVMIGGIELRNKFPQLFVNEENTVPLSSIRQLMKENKLIDLIIYIFVKVYIRINARIRLLKGSWKMWDHDPTARRLQD